jgi:D-alanine transfer protein
MNGRRSREAANAVRQPAAGFSQCAHGVAALAAVGAAILLLAGIDLRDRRLIRTHAAALAPLNLPGAARAVALQRQILRQPGFLPIYGSSEMSTGEPTRPALFFQAHPSGFQVFPVGSAGDRCLIILQELGAVADVIRGRRVVIILSPTWFTPPDPRKDHSAHRQFAARYSPLEAGTLAFGDALSPALERDVAGRLLDYGSVLRERSPLLATALARLRGPTWFGTVLLELLRPLGAAEDFLLRLQDRWQTAALIRGLPGSQPAAGARSAVEAPPIDWTALAASFDHESPGAHARASDAGGKPSAKSPPAARPRDPDADFLRRMDAGKEWIDFGLLLRVLRELGVHALVIDQPINGRWSDERGVSAKARQVYYGRVRRIAAAYGIRVADFSSHEEDPAFFADAVHPSAKAWIYYNQALDEFYHRPTG